MDHDMLFWIGFVILLAVYTKSEEDKNFGNFDIDLSEVGPCEDKGNGDILIEHLAVKMKAKNKVNVTFKATNKVIIDDTVTGTVTVTIFNSESKSFDKEVMRLPVGPVCQAFKTFMPKTVDKFFKSLGLTGCPVPQNTWEGKDLLFEFDFPFSELPYQKFRLEVIFEKDQKRIHCTRVVFSTVPEGTVKY